MSSYADIGFCVKEELAQSMPKDVRDWLEDEAESYFQDGALLYVVRDSKWATDNFPQQGTMLEWLRGSPDNDFLLLVVWHEYPTSCLNDLGYWTMNPFELKRVVRAALEFTE